jgi:hypothetical protein
MRTQIVPQQTVVEEIVSFEHNIGGFVRVLIGKGTVVDNKFQLSPDQTLETVVITDIPGITNSMTGQTMQPGYPEYTELLSANPSWAPTKPQGVFRKEDLWHFVDLIRSRT